MAEIATASSEQAQGVDQINRGSDGDEQRHPADRGQRRGERQRGTGTRHPVRIDEGGGGGTGGPGGRRGQRQQRASLRAGPAAGLKTSLATARHPLSGGKSQANSKALTPEQVIPLEDEDFKDF